MYVPAFKDQHQKIQESIKAVIENWQSGLIPETIIQLKILQAFLRDHHEIEQTLLFQPLSGRPKMNQGGPFCSYFFESFMANRPCVISETMISKLRGQKVHSVIPPSSQKFFEAQDLLTIPIEEHIACEFLCENLIPVLNDYKIESAAAVTDVMDYLKNLISTNHLKEETCLWIAAAAAMEATEYAKLSALHSA